MPPGTIYTVTLNPALDESISIDEFEYGATNRCSFDALDPGGMGVNASRVIYRLGRRTLAFGVAGGVSGGYLSSALDREGVPYDFETVDGVTRVNVMLFESNGGKRTRMHLPGPFVTRANFVAIMRRLEVVAPGEIVILGGSLPPGLAAETYAEIALRLSQRGARCVIDASGAALAAAIETSPLLVKPSVEQAEEMLGRRLQTEEAIIDAACELLERGAQYAVVSRGSSGAIGVGPEGIFNVLPPFARTTSAVGCGDSMTAAMAIAFSEGMNFENALRWGTAAGAATAMTRGTRLCDPLEVYRLIPDVRLNRLSVAGWMRR